MTQATPPHGAPPTPAKAASRAVIPLAIAQFIMVLDSSVMSVSISQLVEEFDTTVSMTTSDAGGPVVMTTTATSDSFTLSARVFKRLGPVVLSAGVVDSHAGVGVEVRGLDDRLRFEVLASESALDPDPSAS